MTITVQDLIKALQRYRQDMPVVVQGFDDEGYEPLTEIKRVRLVTDASLIGMGDHLEETQYASNPVGDPFDALLLN